MYLGDDYIPSRGEIRQHLERCRDYAEDDIENGDLAPEDIERCIWKSALSLARHTDSRVSRGKYYPVPADDRQCRFPLSCRSSR